MATIQGTSVFAIRKASRIAAPLHALLPAMLRQSLGKAFEWPVLPEVKPIIAMCSAGTWEFTRAASMCPPASCKADDTVASLQR